jgi:hypothetical protein
LKPKSYSTIAKIIPQQPSLKSSTPSSKLNTSNPTDEDEEDDDGGINTKKIIKKKQKAEAKKISKDDLKRKKKSNVTKDFLDEDEDEDGGISKQKYKIKETKAKKKSMFAQCFQDQDDDGSLSKQKILEAGKKKQTSEAKKKTTEDKDDDDGVPKRKELSKKKTSNKSNISKKNEDDDNENENGELVVKTYGTIKTVIPPKKPLLDNSKAKDKSSYDNTDDSTKQASKHPKGAAVTSIGTLNLKVSKISTDSRNAKPKKTTDKYDYQIVTTEEEHAVQTTTIDSSPLNGQSSFDNKIYFLRTTSYYEAQQRSPPVISQRLINSSSLRNQIRSCVNNPLNSILKSIKSLSHHSSEQQTLTEENHIEVFNGKQRIIKRKRARTRWYLAYTIIHNPWLSKLRKKALLEEKLCLQHSEQTTQLNRQNLILVGTDQKSRTTTNSMESETLRSRRLR